ncbi:lytic transglycosylase domain-containing protein [Piscinibacter sp. HJYY11]|uniref:lytic transglycosylase domain-containing protein n=1 Tax=Piscinibacter sp. HJYY11 TaxID=2801333 RepID=UPI00191F3F68|nr:lytic transglycosylase domain-containing protein [Piscinibacter sp. HJYY11]MBL0726128.1 lytic transglycosylase domain-containing protein [Piscinibacter sp. HJYY11]
MDATTFLALAATCAPLVHATTAQAIAITESSLNPLAIGVAADSLKRQPNNLPEALTTVAVLRVQRRDFSLGLGQINARNLSRLNLSVADAFDPCKNLGGMQAVLSECYARAPGRPDSQRALREALSCYYSGNFTTGFRHGYVARVTQHARRLERAPP